ncbi:hypothetical protein [Halobacillus sp. B23F22_1]|uniref:hypothetical protein n=1 Tax=Halobacillus sp. B23F22_1 TaxID=3459514 RepID=UPI00373F4DF0
MEKSGDEIENAISTLRKQNNSYLNQIKQLIKQIKTNHQLHLFTYFTYSLNISHNPEQESLCIGSYHLVNRGTVPLHNPYICIKLSENTPFSFSGKYTYEPLKHTSKTPGGWQRLNEKSNKEEFWLKPFDVEVIHPEETLTFSNFQVKWQPTGNYAGSIMGFAYSDETKDGITAVNPISLNGTAY